MDRRAKQRQEDRGRIEAIRFVLHGLDYPDRNTALVGSPDPLIVGPPTIVASDAGETPDHEHSNDRTTNSTPATCPIPTT